VPHNYTGMQAVGHGIRCGVAVGAEMAARDATLGPVPLDEHREHLRARLRIPDTVAEARSMVRTTFKHFELERAAAMGRANAADSVALHLELSGAAPEAVAAARAEAAELHTAVKKIDTGVRALKRLDPTAELDRLMDLVHGPPVGAVPSANRLFRTSPENRAVRASIEAAAAAEGRPVPCLCTGLAADSLRRRARWMSLPACTAVVRPSRVAGGGDGLFADRDYAEGATLAYYTGCYRSGDDASGDRVFAYAHDKAIDANGACWMSQHRGDFVNHMGGGGNNCWLRVNDADDARDVLVEVVAKVLVRQGDELFVDYRIAACEK